MIFYVYKGMKFECEVFVSFLDNFLVQCFIKEGVEILDFIIELLLSCDLVFDGKYEEEKFDYKECKLDIIDFYILMKGRVKDNDLQFVSCLVWEIDGDIRVWLDKVQILGVSYVNFFLAVKIDFV